MKYFVPFLCFLVIFSCEKGKKPKMVAPPIAKQDSSIAIKDIEPKLSDEEILKQEKEREKELSKVVSKYTVEEKYKDFKYKIYCEKEKSEVIGFRKIKIFKDGKFLQKIDIPKDSAQIYYDYEFDFSANEDWNFDGLPDMKLLKFHGMVDAEFYLWLYNNKTKKYDFCPSFGKIVNPVVDKKNKQITSSYHAGPVTYYYFGYKFINGKYVEAWSDVKGDDF
jgi:hypothetical protein